MPRHYGEHTLTEEQKKLVEESLPLVWWYINKQVLAKGTIQSHEIDECSGHLIWYLCMAAESFKSEYGFKFSTYAIRGLRSGLCRYLDLRNRHWEREVLTDYTVRADGDTEGFVVEPEYIEESGSSISWSDLKFLFKMIDMTPMEEQVIFLHYEQKQTYREIGEILGYSRQRIDQIHQNIVLRLRDVVKKRELVMEDFIQV